MKLLKTLLLLIIFCASSLVGFGQEIDKETYPHLKYDLQLQFIILRYQKFLDSPKTQDDIADLERYINSEKQSISIYGDDIENYRIKVDVYSDASFEEIGRLGEIINKSKFFNTFYMSVSLESLMLMKDIESIEYVEAPLRVYEDLNDVADITIHENGTISIEEYKKYDSELIMLIIDYLKFNKSSNTDSDLARYKRTVDYLKSEISIIGDEIEELKVEVIVINTDPKSIPNTIFERYLDYEMPDKYFTYGKIKVSDLLFFKNNDAILRVESGEILRSELDEALPIPQRTSQSPPIK